MRNPNTVYWGREVRQMLTKEGGGVWPKMTDDDDKVRGKKENYFFSAI